MSLLLEALKKAELAKQSADAAPAGSAQGADPVITRDTLPDISQPLEILANDLPSAGPQAAPAQSGQTPLELAPPAATRPDAGAAASTRASFDTAPAAAQPPETGTTAYSDGQRAAARQMFEAKEADLPHPRRNFYITLGILGLVAVGYGGYVWWQMQPRSVYNAAAIAKKGGEAPPPSATQPPPPVPAPPTEPAVPAASETSPSAPAQTPVQATAPGPAVTESRPAAQSAERASATRRAPQAARPAASKPAASRPPAARPSEPAVAPIAVTPPAMVTNQQIERAYTAFQQGDLAEARNQYQRALQGDPANRDALLGLAAIDVRTRNFELAESRYLRLLEADPRDAHALAGLIGLRGQTDPVQTESRLKSMIALQPDVAHLHLALGNQYAAQKRWPEAQASYFRAFSLDPENPDFAFNLAVSLDQMHQAKPALDYYRRALALAGARLISFDKGQVSARITELSRQ